MFVQTPTCHLTLVRESPAKPWAADLTAGYVPADGIVHCETWYAATREELQALLTGLGVNGIQLSPREAAEGDAPFRTFPVTPAEVLSRIAAAPGRLELSLVVLGCTGPEMEARIESVRLVPA
jgi:hypothetical protein